MALPACSDLKPIRLGYVHGYIGKKNEVLYHPPNCQNPVGFIIFFGGDLQDYKENMLKHRDNKLHAEWDLESTCSLLHQHFPDHSIVVIKPSKMTLMTFSCYENFTEVNDFGAPTYTKSCDSLKHLHILFLNLKHNLEAHSMTNSINHSLVTQEIPLKVIGFSKGCIVLNQFLYSFLALKENPDTELQKFVDRISDLYWLEGGHSGTSETWIVNRLVLENFATMGKTVHIHLTPFQISDERPRIVTEEKKFRKSLIKMDCNVKREFYFADEPRSIENHFKVLNVFCGSQ